MQMYEQTLKELYEVIEDELGIEKGEIKETSRISTDLDVNSLELLNLVMAVEEAFNMTFDEDKLKKLKTVGDFANYIVQLKS